MTIHYSDEQVTVHHGDALDVLAAMPDKSVDAVCTDPPYGLEFMGKNWDAPWSAGINADAGFSSTGLTDGYERLPRPSFTGSTNPICRRCGGRLRGRRDGTALRATCTCDDPQFPNVRATEMRAFQAWCEQWATELLRVLKPGGHLLAFGGTRTVHRLTCAIEDAGFEIRDGIDWLYGQGFPKSLNVGNGRGTALKPAREPIVVARKPIVGTVVATLATHGTGALNIDACRIPGEPVVTFDRVAGDRPRDQYRTGTGENRRTTDGGRWPSNVVLSHVGDEHVGDLCADGCTTGCPVAEVDQQSGYSKSSTDPNRFKGSRKFNGATYAGDKYTLAMTSGEAAVYDDSGGASRFFPTFRYQAKAASRERPRDGQTAHCTVKPLDLMRWLVRLVTPPGGIVLDPFAGSGTTAEACLIEGFRCITIEREAAYLPLIAARLSKPIQPTLDLFGGAA